METLADLVAAGRERDGTAVAVPTRTTDYGYGDFCTGVWKSGNLLRHYGLRAGASSAVAIGPKDGDGEAGYADAADPLLAVLGSAALGATVDPAPPAAVAARTLVLPAAWLDRYDPDPGCSLLAYGGPPEEPDVAHFERERWSENPIQPPDPPDPAAEVLAGYSHGDLLAAGERVVDEYGIEVGDRVAVCAPLTQPGALVAGVVAPLSVGATAVLVAPGDDPDEPSLVVGSAGDIDPAAVLS